jgi:hypothetical protein
VLTTDLADTIFNSNSNSNGSGAPSLGSCGEQNLLKVLYEMLHREWRSSRQVPGSLEQTTKPE